MPKSVKRSVSLQSQFKIWVRNSKMACFIQISWRLYGTPPLLCRTLFIIDFFSLSSSLGFFILDIYPPKGRYTLDIFARDISIKRYCDKKTFFSLYFFPVCIEIFIFVQLCLLKPTLKIFWNVITIFLRKNIFLSKCLFIAILCLKMSSVYKP